MTSTRSCPCALRRGAASPFSAIAIFGTLALLTPMASAAPGAVDFEPLFAAGRPLEVVQATDMVLHEAAAVGDVELAAYLLERGAGVDVRSAIDASTPLHVAAHSGHIEVVRLLIAKGAGIGARAQGGNTPLHMAALGGHAEIVELLMSHGAEVNVTTNSTSTALHLAAREGHADLVGLLLRHGAKVESRRAHYLRTPLMDAALNGHVEVVALLLRNGADVTVRDAENNTALSLAQVAGHGSIADMLRSHGATD